MRRFAAALEDFGQMIFFFLETLAWTFRPPYRPALILSQMAFIGAGSVFIVGVTGTFTGLTQGRVAPGGTHANLRFLQSCTTWQDGLTKEEQLVLCDAQTSGGLLVAIALERLAALPVLMAR